MTRVLIAGFAARAIAPPSGDRARPRRDRAEETQPGQAEALSADATRAKRPQGPCEPPAAAQRVTASRPGGR